MGDNNSIRFIADNPNEIHEARSNHELAEIEGRAVIKADNVNMTEKVGPDYIIWFASGWLEKVPEILSGKETAVEHTDDSWQFIFNREKSNDSDFISCSSKFNNESRQKDLKYPTRDYCVDLLCASAELFKQMEKNDLRRIFKLYNAYEAYMINAASVMVSSELLTKKDIENIFSRSDFLNKNCSIER